MAIIIDERDLERARQEKEGKHQQIKKCDRLTAFLYGLVKDKLTIGEVEEFLESLGDGPYIVLQNAWLIEYAEGLRRRLSNEPEPDNSGLCTCMQKLKERGLIEYNGKGEWLFMRRKVLRSSVEYETLGPCPICGKTTEQQ